MAILDFLLEAPEGYEYLQYIINSMFLLMIFKAVFEGIFELAKQVFRL